MEKHEKNNSGEFFARANDESINDDNLRDLFKQFFPVDTPQWNHHLQAYLKRHNVMRILYFNEIYQNILTIPGDILDFGVHYGARSQFQPYSAHVIIGDK